jgi:hypothetical protein
MNDLLLHQSDSVKVIGIVTVTDPATGELIFTKKNAVHPQNMARVISKALARDSNGYIFKISFGNGGTFLNSSSQLVFRPPNTIGTSADLYNLTYEVQVDDQSVGTPSTNNVTSSASPNPAITSLVTVTAMLNSGEPNGQATSDGETVDLGGSPYVFDEIGLKTNDGFLLTHTIFSPIQKSTNRAFLITYTLTISVS